MGRSEVVSGFLKGLVGGSRTVQHNSFKSGPVDKWTFL